MLNCPNLYINSKDTHAQTWIHGALGTASTNTVKIYFISFQDQIIVVTKLQVINP